MLRSFTDIRQLRQRRQIAPDSLLDSIADRINRHHRLDSQEDSNVLSHRLSSLPRSAQRRHVGGNGAIGYSREGKNGGLLDC